MNRKREVKIHTSVWVNKRYSAVLQGPAALAAPAAPPPMHRLPAHMRRAPPTAMAAAQKGPRGAALPRPRNLAPPLAPPFGSSGIGISGPRFASRVHFGAPGSGPLHFGAPRGGVPLFGQHCPTPLEELSRLFSQMPSLGVDEPFFASNLKYYPHLPQPDFVGPYQTYAQVKAAMARCMGGGDPAHPLPLPLPLAVRACSQSKESLEEEELKEPQEPLETDVAFCRRFWMTGQSGLLSLSNLLFSASGHLLQQSSPELQRQMELQLRQRDPLLTRFLSLQDDLLQGRRLPAEQRRWSPMPMIAEEASGGLSQEEQEFP
ncbi:uncharacterized protein LOC108097224 [Drosophila ficusphila]|uniref:uncharacterized protein LOC108097224 n=1 Tax=Drosophila ficusphila TaxID=30025 RepID=UPI0007E61AE3|nr:uncharacterized protein LOC108097224 [Drosophila ficusphila]